MRVIRLLVVLALALAVSSACGEIDGSVLDDAAESSPTSASTASSAVTGLARVDQILAEGGATPLIRTDFSDDAAWDRAVTAARTPWNLEGGPVTDDTPEESVLTAWLEPVDDAALRGATGASLARAFADTEYYMYAVLADRRTMREAAAGREVTFAYVDLSIHTAEDADLFGSHLGRTFRCTASELAAVETNLTLANMDFRDFADHSDPDGVFRGDFDAG